MIAKNAVLKSISLLGFVLVLLLIFSLAGHLMSVLVLFWAAAACFIWASVKFSIKTVYFCAGVFLLSFLFQTVYSSQVRILGETDLQFYYESAKSMAENSFRLESMYNATFPGTVTYPSILAVLFRVFGARRILPVLLNQAVMSATIVLVYLFVKHRRSHLSGAVCAMLLATHPFVIIYSNTTNAEILFGACILWSFITYYFAHVKYLNSGAKLWFILPAVFLGLSLFFRPMGLIMLVALLLHSLVFSKIKLLDNLIICPILIAGFLLFNFLCGAIVKGVTSYDSPGSAYGWNLYVGASEKGQWNPEDAAAFGRVSATASSPTEVQSHFAGEGFARYREIGSDIFEHGRKKMLEMNSADYMVYTTFQLTDVSEEKHELKWVEYALPIYLYYVPILILALAFCLMSFFRSFRGKSDELTILSLYTVGSFAAFVFLEVAPRYAVSYHIMFTILAFEAALSAAGFFRNRKELS